MFGLNSFGDNEKKMAVVERRRTSGKSAENLRITELSAAFADGDSELMIMAIGNVAKAMGMSEISRKTNLSRQNLYKPLSPHGSPKFETVKKVVEALGCNLSVV